MDSNLVYLIIGAVVVILVALLYPRFYRTRDSDGRPDELNWVNKSSYDTKASDSQKEAIEGASAAEARKMAEDLKNDPNHAPVDDETFYRLNKKMGAESVDSEQLNRKLQNPSS